MPGNTATAESSKQKRTYSSVGFIRLLFIYAILLFSAPSRRETLSMIPSTVSAWRNAADRLDLTNVSASGYNTIRRGSSLCDRWEHSAYFRFVRLPDRNLFPRESPIHVERIPRSSDDYEAAALGADALIGHPETYVDVSSGPLLDRAGNAAIAFVLEELAKYGLIADVQPCFSGRGAGFRYRVTPTAAVLLDDTNRFEAFLNRIAPKPEEFEVFISYATADSPLACEFKASLDRRGIACFLSEKDIAVADEWQDRVRTALLGSRRIMILVTPRSLMRPWVLLETGAAWALGKPLIPALVQVSPSELGEPIRRYRPRTIETTAERESLIDEIARSASFAGTRTIQTEPSPFAPNSTAVVLLEKMKSRRASEDLNPGSGRTQEFLEEARSGGAYGIGIDASGSP